MQDLWDRIDAALTEQVARHNADIDEDDREELSLDRLKGATPAQLDALATLIGYPLPEDFRESFLIRDGFRYRIAPYGAALSDSQFLLNLEGITREVKFWGEFLREDPDHAAGARPDCRPAGPVAPIMWSRGWLPFVGEGSGNHLCLDLDPPAGGTAGQVFDFGHEEGPTRVFFPSFRAYMERFALDLKSGALRFDIEANHGEYTAEVAEYRGQNPGKFDPNGGA